jgi:hypothetical protein
LLCSGLSRPTGRDSSNHQTGPCLTCVLQWPPPLLLPAPLWVQTATSLRPDQAASLLGSCRGVWFWLRLTCTRRSSPARIRCRTGYNSTDFWITPVKPGFTLYRLHWRSTGICSDINLGQLLASYFSLFLFKSPKNSGKSSVLSEKFACGNSRGSSDFPFGLRPLGKSDDPREIPRANFSRQHYGLSTVYTRCCRSLAASKHCHY